MSYSFLLPAKPGKGSVLWGRPEAFILQSLTLLGAGQAGIFVAFSELFHSPSFFFLFCIGGLFCFSGGMAYSANCLEESRPRLSGWDGPLPAFLVAAAASWDAWKCLLGLARLAQIRHNVWMPAGGLSSLITTDYHQPGQASSFFRRLFACPACLRFFATEGNITAFNILLFCLPFFLGLPSQHKLWKSSLLGCLLFFSFLQ